MQLHKLFSTALLGAAMAVAMLSMPTTAAVAPDGGGTSFTLAAKQESAPAMQCLASFDIKAAVLFVEALDDCNPALEAATGLCFAPVAGGTRVVALTVPPDASMTCAPAPHPSPG